MPKTSSASGASRRTELSTVVSFLSTPPSIRHNRKPRVAGKLIYTSRNLKWQMTLISNFLVFHKVTFLVFPISCRKQINNRAYVHWLELSDVIGWSTNLEEHLGDTRKHLINLNLCILTTSIAFWYTPRKFCIFICQSVQTRIFT